MAQIKLRDPFNTAPVANTGTQAAGESTIRLSVDLERSLHRRLRRLALDHDRTAADIVRELITSALQSAGY